MSDYKRLTKEEMIQCYTEQIVNSFGIPDRVFGKKHLIRAVELARKTDGQMWIGEIYEKIGEESGTEPHKVQRNLRYVRDLIISNQSGEYESIFYLTPRTLADLIYGIGNYVERKMSNYEYEIQENCD